MAWKVGKQLQLNNSLEIATWRQVLGKEKKHATAKTLAELEELKGELERKNDYMHLFKNGKTLKTETIREKQGRNTVFVYDQAQRDYDTDATGYDQKAARESLWSKTRHPRALPKETLGAPLTSNQVLGWRPPIDDMSTGFNRSAVCQRTFHDAGHL